MRLRNNSKRKHLCGRPDPYSGSDEQFEKHLALIVLAALWILPGDIHAATFTWNLDADGNWNVNGNWNHGGIPNGASHDAVLGNIITAPRIITLGQDIVVGSLTANSAIAYSITGNTLSLNTSGGSDLTQSGAGALTINSGLKINSNMIFAGDGAGLVTVNGVLSDASGNTLTKNGEFTIVLNNNNTLGGGITLNAGTLRLGHDSAAGTGTFTLNGGTIEASGGARVISVSSTIGGNFSIGGSSGLTLSGAMSLGSSTRTVTVNNTADTTFSGVLSGSGGFTKSGTGLLILSQANTFSGATTVSGGTLSIAAQNALASTASLTLSSGGTLLLDAATGSRVNDSAALTLNGGTLSSASFSETFGGLTLAADSTITLGAGGTAGTLTFASGTRTGGRLTIQNWSGLAQNGGTDDRIFISSDPGADFLGAVDFSGYASGASYLSSGEIVPLPETEEYMITAALALLCGTAFRLHRCSRMRDATTTNFPLAG